MAKILLLLPSLKAHVLYNSDNFEPVFLHTDMKAWSLSDNLEFVFTGTDDKTNRCFIFNIANSGHFRYTGHVTCCAATTHPCKRVCLRTVLVRVTLALAGVQVYAGHVLSALYNKEEA